ncbi:MAG TPA: adenylate/guanylate cyclase domain-containing protein [Candidatus Wallbacteria bacterium]|nr:MAG: Adenylate cyclase 1 [bacterium ADurb.Bin243]HOD38916.1 adenylate/guanylate cyclase domain-containing protein [Candidatus Wallbacteria bacterium]HPG58006.1 adenylate/guanylate cyclase domain-containing protein [Candidatus Wallbacteria bacterium]
MSFFDSIDAPVETDLLVSFFDLTNFVKITNSHSGLELFGLLSDFYEMTDRIIRENGGRIIKFIGDAGLIVFEPQNADRGVKALMRLQKDSETFFESRKVHTRLIVKAHFGSAACGKICSGGGRRLDVFGETVNTAATLASKGFAISPQAFRKLSAETRKLFHKLTPPITYVITNG